MSVTIPIKLTRGKVALIDERDYARVSMYRWSARPGYGGVWYAIGGRVKTSLHRFVMRAKKGEIVDHIDGNGLNNSRSNLRICSTAQNNANWRPRAGVREGQFKGVHWTPNGYIGCFSSQGRGFSTAYYETPEAAAREYDELLVMVHGEFACTNEMLGLYETRKLGPEEATRRAILAAQ